MIAKNEINGLNNEQNNHLIIFYFVLSVSNLKINASSFSVTGADGVNRAISILLLQLTK